MRVLYAFILLQLIACQKNGITVDALIPDYFDAMDFSGIATLEPQEVVNLGDIVKVGDFLFVNDRKLGIHVIDNSIPGDPNYIYFWKIPGNQRFTIRDNYLYADNGPHMLVINISDFENIKYESYIENVFYENMREQFPAEAQSGEYFLCPDPDKGLVKSWRIETVENPPCQKI